MTSLRVASSKIPPRYVQFAVLRGHGDAHAHSHANDGLVLQDPILLSVDDEHGVLAVAALGRDIQAMVARRDGKPLGRVDAPDRASDAMLVRIDDANAPLGNWADTPQRLERDSIVDLMAKKRTHFKKVLYTSLNARQKELFNFQKIAATLADYGFNCIKLADDWQGADFLAYHLDGTTTLRVQLKSRLAIQRKYLGKNIWMAFPHESQWYPIEHDQLVSKVGKATDWLKSRSWRKDHSYSSGSINGVLLRTLAENKLGRVYGTILPEDG